MKSDYGDVIPMTSGRWRIDRIKGVMADFVDEWTRVRCMSKSAALAFYTAFSLAPMLLLVVIVGALFVDRASMQEALLTQVGDVMGNPGRQLFAEILAGAQRPGQGIPALFGIMMLLFGATTAFAELKDSLDEIFHVPFATTGGIRQFMLTRLLSLVLIAALVFLLLAALTVEAVLTSMASRLAQTFAERLAGGRIFTFLVGLIGSFALFLAIYALLPARRVPWRALIFGVIASTLLFTLGRFAIGFYLGVSDAITTFGAAGSLAIVLLWIYYSSLAFFAGALAAQVFEHSSAAKTTSEASAAASAPTAS